jgi:hypothetical protein
MRITILPKTRLGLWSIGLVVVSILFFVLFQIMLGPGPDYNMTLANVLTIVLAITAVVAFVTGLSSILSNKERSILVFVAMAISLYSLIGGIASLVGLSK